MLDHEKGLSPQGRNYLQIIDHTVMGGKFMRSALCLETYSALNLSASNKDLQMAAKMAVVIELVSHFFDIIYFLIIKKIGTFILLNINRLFILLISLLPPLYLFIEIKINGSVHIIMLSYVMNHLVQSCMVLYNKRALLSIIFV